MQKHGKAPTFADCLEHFNQTTIDAPADDLRHNNFEGLTQSEIDSKYHKAESEYSHAQADYRRHMDLAKTGTMPNNDELAHARDAQRRMEAAEKEMNKWKYTHPDKK